MQYTYPCIYSLNNYTPPPLTFILRNSPTWIFLTDWRLCPSENCVRLDYGLEPICRQLSHQLNQFWHHGYGLIVTEIRSNKKLSH